jgi:hypothetical protein
MDSRHEMRVQAPRLTLLGEIERPGDHGCVWEMQGFCYLLEPETEGYTNGSRTGMRSNHRADHADIRLYRIAALLHGLQHFHGFIVGIGMQRCQAYLLLALQSLCHQIQHPGLGLLLGADAFDCFHPPISDFENRLETERGPEKLLGPSDAPSTMKEFKRVNDEDYSDVIRHFARVSDQFIEGHPIRRCAGNGKHMKTLRHGYGSCIDDLDPGVWELALGRLC